MKLHVHKLLLPPRPFSVKLRDSSLFKVSNLPSRDSDDDFLPWLEKKAGVEISSKLYMGKSSYGRSLFASKRIETGDCILKVPYSVQISPDNLCPGFKTLLGGKVGNTSKLALVVMLQQRIGQKSDWAPYIRCLPKYCDVNCSIFWSRRELEMIQQSSVYQETLKHKAQIERDFLTIKSVRALGHFPEVGSITIMEFMHCYALVGSRAWGSIKGLSLIPFADFMNHDGVSEAIVVNNDDKQVSEVTADRVYAPHDEVVIRYGKFSNAALLLDFGFTIPNNIFDEVRIQMDIPLHDPLRQMKLETLETHCIPIGQQASGFDALGDSFLIKEIRSPKGNGKGLPQPLRALARVLCCTSRRELNDLVLEAAQNDGRLARRPLKNINREFKAHNILLSHINRLADGYSASVQSLSMAHSSSACTRFTHRKQMAMDLLTGELRVLKAASVWLKNYCESLMQQTIDVSGINH